ncbi:Phosphatidate phosphatase PAH2 [Spatholobus suberectus]|nr:Phosphatidate phosphatase PAH2 [Spatholobus suberectus]
MQAVGRIISQGVYTVSGPFHPFGGAVDIVVVEQQDGSFKSSPWYVRFGKFQGVLKAREKVVDICVNGVQAGFQMQLDHKGEAFFLREIDAEEEANLMFPSSSGDDVDDHSRSRSLGSNSCNYDGGEVVGKTSSRRSQILGLVFGRRSLKRGEDGDDGIGNRVGSLERAEIAANLLDLKWSTNLSGEHGQNVLANSSGDGNVVVENGELNQEVCFGGECDLNGKEVVYDISGSDVQVACVEVKLVERELNGEEVSGVSAVDAPGDDSDVVSQEGVSADGACRETSETSKLGVDCSSEQAREVVYLAGTGCGEVRVHVHDEVLHGATVLLSEGTEAEEVIENADLGMPVLEFSELHSQVQQTDCLDSNDSTYNEVDVEVQPTSPKPQTVKMGLGHCSSEKVELNCVIISSSYSSLDDQALDENNMKDKDVSSTLSSPLDSVDDCLPRKASRRSPSPGSEDENFLFSDLDESVINNRFERSFSPEHVDKEDHVSYENDTEKLTAVSSPIAIHRNEAAGEEIGQHSESLPNISSSSDSMVQHDVRYPFSQSLDSKSISLPWTFPGKDDLECLKSEGDKGNQLSHEEPGAKDYHDSGELKGTVLKLPLGDPSTHNPSPGGNWKIWPFSLRRTESRNPRLPPSPSDAKNTTFGNPPENTISTDMNKNELKPNIMKKTVRETTPTSEQLASLNLKDGMNTVTFTFSTAVLGNQQVDARIYLWKWNTRIVISDVDGTITRSDVLGQFMPLVGIDWSQTGVAHLFSAIKENGYQLLFLSARSISQAYLTRQFLLNLRQDGKVLPDGPVVISPDGLFPSLYREVIRRVPHEFKIACLEDIRALFPSDCNPFYAGFGNRDTDEISYLKVGIPKGKIFIINPRGEVVVNRRVDTKSYTSLHALVNGMFPPTSSSEQEDFNSWNFWKLPPPAIDI